MRISYLVTFFLLILLSGNEASAQPKDSRLTDVSSFALALGDDLSGDYLGRLGQYDLVVVDGENTPALKIRNLKNAGCIVLGYLSIGTIERSRSWYGKVARYRLDFWEDWGEWYADVNYSGYRAEIVRVGTGFLRKGFDGLFVDNLDMVLTHSRQRTGMKKLMSALSKMIHSRHRYLFAQNGDKIIGEYLRYLDGWNREDVNYTYDFEAKRYVPTEAEEQRTALATLAQVFSRGKLVTTTDYQNSIDTAVIENIKTSSCAVNAVPFVSDIELSKLPESPITCP